jgi:hypothetical protein
VKRLFKEIFGVDCTDGILFDHDSLAVAQVREDEEYEGLRITGDARLDAAVIKLQIDIGFGDKIYPATKRKPFPCLLPGMPAAEILVYPPETVIAEKFEAMVRFGETTSRLKDFYDIWTISGTFSFEMADLAEAIRGTFRQRGTDLPAAMPFVLTAAFTENPDKIRMWEGFLRRNPPPIAPPPFDEIVGDIRSFLGPVLGVLALPEGAAGTWTPGNGWTEPTGNRTVDGMDN